MTPKIKKILFFLYYIGTYTLPIVTSDIDFLVYAEQIHQLAISQPMRMYRFPSGALSALATITDQRISPSFSSKSLFMPLKATDGTEIPIQVFQCVVAWQDLTLGVFLDKLPTLYMYREMAKFYVPQSPDNTQELIPRFSSLEAFKTYISLFTKGDNENLYQSLQKTYGDVKFSAPVLDVNMGAGEASCGYHTILNLQLILQSLLEETVQEPQQNPQTSMKIMSIQHHLEQFGTEDENKKLFNESEGVWRKWIKEQNKHFKVLNAQAEAVQLLKLTSDDLKKLQQTPTGLADDNGEWLTLYGMKALAASLYDTKILPHAPKLSQNFPIFINTVPTPNDWAQYNAFGIALQTEPVHDKHWYGIVLFRRNRRFLKKTYNAIDFTVIIVDSKNTARYQDPTFREALSILFNTPQKDISLSTMLETPSLGTIQQFNRTQRLYTYALNYYLEQYRNKQAAHITFDTKQFVSELYKSGWSYGDPTPQELADIKEKIDEILNIRLTYEQ